METLLAQDGEDTLLHMLLPAVVETLEWVAAAIDLCAIALLVAIRSAISFVLDRERAQLRREAER